MTSVFRFRCSASVLNVHRLGFTENRTPNTETVTQSRHDTAASAILALPAAVATHSAPGACAAMRETEKATACAERAGRPFPLAANRESPCLGAAGAILAPCRQANRPRYERQRWRRAGCPIRRSGRFPWL